MKSTIKLACFLLVLVLSKLNAQMSGPYTVPGSYASIGLAIADLNTQGVSGAVTINIAAGHTETASVGGYTLNSITGASATNSIVIQKSGAGANPIVYAYAGGVGTPATAVQDGVIRFVGTDFVTVDGIDITDPNAANPATMEFGYGFFKASVTNGCQNNTIQNCVITLNRINNVAGSGPSIDGSRGIDVVNATTAAHITALTITNATGANSNNKFYNNLIQNCNYGISLIGYAAASPFTNSDTGNDIGGLSSATSNTIINFGGGGTTACAGVRTLAQQNVNVSYNLINNNNGGGVNHTGIARGIFVNTATSANSTINNNTLTIHGGGTTQNYFVIDNVSGSTAASNTISISNNLIINCTYATATNGDFMGIQTSSTPQALSINSNSFVNNTSSATGAQSYYLINVTGNVAGAMNINNNLLNMGTFDAASTSLELAGIFNTGGILATTTLNVNNNTFQNANFTGTTGGTGDTYFIYSNSPSNSTFFNNNTFNNVSLKTSGDVYLMYNSNTTPNQTANNNSITTGFAKTAAGGIFYGYYNVAAPTSGLMSLSGNNFSNISFSGTGTFTGFNLDGSITQAVAVNNNTITNISGLTGVAKGINIIRTAPNSTVTGNFISNISGGGDITGISGPTATGSNSLTIFSNTLSAFSTTGAAVVSGITQTSGSAIIYKNRLYNFESNNAGGTAVGISFPSGTAVSSNVYNNLIGDLRAPAASNTNAVIGINLNGGATHNIYYNTVNLNASSTGTLFGSSAVYVNSTPTTINLQNNIFVNTSVATGTGVTAAHRRASAVLTNYATTSNNNLYYAGTPGVANLVFSDGTNAVQTLGAYQTLMSTRDGNAVTENPSFVSVLGTNANFLNINTATPTQIESGALPIAGITDDYAGAVRNVTTPDIGAWEGTYVISDITPPVMTGSGFTTPGCILTGRTFTASFTDLTGVASGALAPRIYYKVNAGAYASASGTLTSGTANNGVWTFSMTYTGALSDIISYFVVVQDAFATPNLVSFPSAGFAGTDVNTITSNPTTPNTYGINGLNGVYTVGSAGTFTSLTAAAAAYNTYCLLGPVTFSLTDALYSTAETFPIVFLNNPDASATNSLLIRPATGVAVALTPTNTSISSVIKFLNARYITMDGLNTGGSSLAVNNANVSSVSANIWLGSTGAGNNFIAVKNTALKGGYNGGSNGVIASIDGALPSTTGGSDNDNITFTGNSFLTFYQGILAVGSASISAGGMDNWIVSNNVFGPVTSGTSNIGGNAIVMFNALNFAAGSNTIQNISTGSAGVSGINLNGNVTGFMISQNIIQNITSSTTSGGVDAISGVYLGAQATNGTVTANAISVVYNSNTGGYGARGINVNTSNSLSAVSINNNFIADVYSFSDVGTNWWPIGIGLEGTSGGINIDNNTVNIFRTFAGLAGANGSAAMFINATGGALNIRNNIFSNTYNNSTSTTDINYGIYSAVASTNFSSINYNNYYVGTASNSNPVLGYLGVNQTNIAGIQTAFGGNLNSTNVLPVFVSNTDLHMQPVIGNLLLDNTGTPLAGITIDIDNQSRSLTAPDMGADEFSIPSCTNALGGTIAPTSTLVCSGSTLTATSTGVSTGLNTVYQWEVGATPGGPYINVTGGAGASTPSYTSAALTTGVYYVRLKTTCTTMTAASNEVTVTVNALPTAIAGVTSATICAGQSLNLNGSGTATSFTWTGPNSYSTTTQNAIVVSAAVAASGIYSLTGTGNGCTSTVGVVSVTVNAVPSAVTVTPNSATVCAGGSQTLATLGGTIPKIYAFGAQTNTNSAVTTSLAYPAPYNTFYGGQKMQMLILASELTTAGFSAGNALTNIQFPVVSLGSNWGTSITSNQSFQVNIGPTALTSLTTFQTGLTNVVAPANFVPAVGYGNTHTFSTPFIWNGTDNIILETTFSNNFLATANDAIVQYNSPTSYQSTLVYRADSQTPAVMAGQTASTFAYSVRPDFKLNGTEIGTFSWAPAATLSSATGSSVTATPLANTVYTVSSSNGACASPIGTATLSIAPAITVSIAATPTAVCAGDATTLTASGATSYTWDPTNMTNTISVSPAVGTTVYTVTAQSGNCAAVTETISIISHALPPVQASANPTLVCSGQSATLTGSGATTYSWVSGPATSTYAVNTAASYTVTGTDANGCSDDATLTVGSGTLPVVSASPATLAVCASSPASFTASGAATYSWSSGSTNTVLTVNAGANTVYTVTGFASTGCSATQTVGLTSLALPVLTVSPASPTICNTESVTLTASGATTFSWLPGTTTTTTLSVHPSATTSYSVDGMDANGCTGTKVVMVTVDPCTGVKESALSGKVNLYPNPSTGLITAEFGFDGVKNIVVFNSVGAVILNTNTQEQSATFDLSAFAKGVYFVNVKTNESSANYKIVIQ